MRPKKGISMSEQELRTKHLNFHKLMRESLCREKRKYTIMRKFRIDSISLIGPGIKIPIMVRSG